MINEYKKDVKDFETLNQMLQKINFKDLDVSLVYKAIDTLNEIYRYINIFDKYYNSLSRMNNTKNLKYNEIISLYDTYNKKYSEFVEEIKKRFKLEDFTNKKYIAFLKKCFESKIVSSSNYIEYSKLYKQSEKIYNSYDTNLPLDKQIELMVNYVQLKEKLAKIKGYNSLLDEKLAEIGLQNHSFMRLIEESYKELVVDNDSKNMKMELENALKMVINLETDKLKISVLKDVSKNVIVCESRGLVLSSYGKMPLIFLNYDDSLRSLIKLVHELGHAYHYKIAMINQLKDYDPKQFISEMYAIYSQIKLEFRLMENDNSLNEYFIDDYNNFFVDALNSLKFQYYVNCNFNAIRTNSVDLNSIDKNWKDHIKYVFDDFYDINYLFGFLIALYLHEFKVLQSDIDDVLVSNGNLAASESLEKIGIDINDEKFIVKLFDNLNSVLTKVVDKKRILI